MPAAPALLALLAVLGPLAARADDDPGSVSPPIAGADQPAVAAAAAAPPRAGGWYALPVVFWLPETRLGFGGTGGLHLELGGERPSSLFAAAVYTLEGQGSLDLAWDVYRRSGALLSGRVRAIHWPDAFYGI